MKVRQRATGLIRLTQMMMKVVVVKLKFHCTWKIRTLSVFSSQLHFMLTWCLKGTQKKKKQATYCHVLSWDTSKKTKRKLPISAQAQVTAHKNTQQGSFVFHKVSKSSLALTNVVPRAHDPFGLRRSLAQTKRIVGSGDEIDQSIDHGKHRHAMRAEPMTFFPQYGEI